MKTHKHIMESRPPCKHELFKDSELRAKEGGNVLHVLKGLLRATWKIKNL